jgi:tryptophan synthase alpha chain
MPNNHYPDPLANFLRERKKSKEILLVSHAVLGSPSFAACRESIGVMAETGTDIVELQIPFSDPLADGPYFTHANEESVRSGTTVAGCFDFAREMAETHPDVAFVFMTYYNIVYRYGTERFAADAAASGMRGIIVPDLPMLAE